MTVINTYSADSSPESFLITVVVFIIIAGFAMYAFRIFPFDSRFPNNADSITIQSNGPVANPEPSLRL